MEKYSVLMSVYHKEKADYLRSAMNSIWEQTVPADDFVLVCDGPLTPELDSVISDMEKEHGELHVVRLEKNGGLGNALNTGIRYCRTILSPEWILMISADLTGARGSWKSSGHILK